MGKSTLSKCSGLFPIGPTFRTKLLVAHIPLDWFHGMSFSCRIQGYRQNAWHGYSIQLHACLILSHLGYGGLVEGGWWIHSSPSPHDGGTPSALKEAIIMPRLTQSSSYSLKKHKTKKTKQNPKMAEILLCRFLCTRAIVVYKGIITSK